MYGGTDTWFSAGAKNWGLSPRVRGNLSTPRPGRRRSRSIPACTGEPLTHCVPTHASEVYPRVYGGTTPDGLFDILAMGLPRVRGNPVHDLADTAAEGLSPRVRGNRVLGWQRYRSRVYPRVYGGTRSSLIHPSFRNGLSPRVRGNPLRTWTYRNGRRSIPACTGEPGPHRLTQHAGAVYPRVYGGTDGDQLLGEVTAGLSPRVRGNRTRMTCPFSVQRSIPACTGEPVRRRLVTSGAYGLSPRVRGNHGGRDPGEHRERSIPACTGEPIAALSRLNQCPMPVYPRVYGGTGIECAGEL